MIAGVELGDRVGAGRTAEVFALGADTVLKLLRPGIPEALGEHEAFVAEVVDRASVAAPRFFGTSRVEGRLGLVYERLAGPSMLDRMARRPLELDGLARAFAGLHAGMHATAGDGLVDQSGGVRRMIDRGGDALPQEDRDAVLARLDALPGGGAICHGDFHPGNVLLTADGPRVIDWMTVTAGSPEADVARTLFLLREARVPPYVPRLQRAAIVAARRRFAAVYRRRYAELRFLDDALVEAWRLPVLAARLGEGIEHERDWLVAEVRRGLAASSA